MFEKLKEYITKSKTETQTNSQDSAKQVDKTQNPIYQLVQEELKNYIAIRATIEKEEKLLNGRPHQTKQKIEDKILELIETDESILEIQEEKTQFNIGMEAIVHNLDRVAMRALQNNTASTQQSSLLGHNMCMMALHQLKYDLLYEAIKNPEAIRQVDKGGRNIGMMCMDPSFINETELRKIALILLDDDVVATTVTKGGYNMGMLAAERKYQEVVMKALDNPVASTQRSNAYFNNIGMLCIENGLEDCAMKALKNPEASLQTDYKGRNMGNLAADNKMESVVIEALKNPEASVQVDVWGFTIGMRAAANCLTDAMKIAYQNPEAKLIHNKWGESIVTIAKDNDILDVLGEDAQDDLDETPSAIGTISYKDIMNYRDMENWR